MEHQQLKNMTQTMQKNIPLEELRELIAKSRWTCDSNWMMAMVMRIVMRYPLIISSLLADGQELMANHDDGPHCRITQLKGVLEERHHGRESRPGEISNKMAEAKNQNNLEVHLNSEYRNGCFLMEFSF